MAMECLSRWGGGPGYVGFNGWDFHGEPPLFRVKTMVSGEDFPNKTGIFDWKSSMLRTKHVDFTGELSGYFCWTPFFSQKKNAQ